MDTGMKLFSRLISQLEGTAKRRKVKRDDLSSAIGQDKTLTDEQMLEMSSQEIAEVLGECFNSLTPMRSVEKNMKLLGVLVTLQAGFYNLSPKKSEKTADWYHYLAKNHLEIYEELVPQLEGEISELTFKYDPSKPLVDLLNELDRFYRVAKLYLNFSANVPFDTLGVNPNGIAAFVVFHKEIIGNEDKWSSKLRDMLDIYIAYKKVKAGTSRRKLIPILGLNKEDQPNSLKKIRDYLAEAERLISSAEKGTFPY